MCAYVFLPAKREQLEEIVKLELASYPADEAATPEKLEFRLTNAPAYFYALSLCEEGKNRVVGFVTGTRAKSTRLEEEAMVDHRESGATLAIHSVVVEETLRKRGLATFMVRQYLNLVARGAGRSGIDRVVLLSKEWNQRLYQRCGFEVAGISAVSHGSEEWLELRQPLQQRSGLDVAILSAFVDPSRPLGTGNQAAVVVIPWEGSGGVGESGEDVEVVEKYAGALAADFGYAETAFVQPCEDGTWQLRWFTPATEVDLCGHATLAAAAALWNMEYIPSSQTSIHFHTRSGILTAEKDAVAEGEEGAGVKVVLDFPAERALEVREGEGKRSEIVEMVEKMTGVPGCCAFVGKNRFDYLVHVSRPAFLSLTPSIPAIASLEDARGLLITSNPSDVAGGGGEGDESAKYSFESRCFFPRCGVDEDGVTGSAHCALGPYWDEKEGMGKDEDGWMIARQASKRSGVLYLKCIEDRVKLKGSVNTISTGVIATPAPSSFYQRLLLPTKHA